MVFIQKTHKKLSKCEASLLAAGNNQKKKLWTRTLEINPHSVLRHPSRPTIEYLGAHSFGNSDADSFCGM